jgi:hypothetical protein
MWTTNQGLTERHAFDSRPEHWPVLRRGIVSFVKYVRLPLTHALVELLGEGPQTNLPDR